MAKLSDGCCRSTASRAMIGASFSAARALGKAASRAASSQGSKPSRVKPETTLSGIPFCSSPTAAKRKSFRSEWSSENRAGSAMIALKIQVALMPSGWRRYGSRVARSEPSSSIASRCQLEFLQTSTELFCASADNRGVRNIASRHGRPTALFDDRSPVPGSGNLGEFDQFCRCVRLMPEFFDANRRQHLNHRSLCSLPCHSLSGTAERPSER